MLSLNHNQADNTINIFEQEMISCFEVHHATGKKWYPYELKEMIFKAFHQGMSVDKIIKITKVPAYIIYKWHRVFEFRETSRPTVDSQFREIRVVHQPLEEKEQEIENNFEQPINRKVSLIFPNGVNLYFEETILNKRLLQDLYSLQERSNHVDKVQ